MSDVPPSCQLENRGELLSKCDGTKGKLHFLVFCFAAKKPDVFSHFLIILTHIINNSHMCHIPPHAYL